MQANSRADNSITPTAFATPRFAGKPAPARFYASIGSHDDRGNFCMPHISNRSTVRAVEAISLDMQHELRAQLHAKVT